MNWLNPAWRSSEGGAVRQNRIAYWLRWAWLVQTLRPVTDQPPSTFRARVWTDARSEPASGSLMQIAK